LRQRRLVFLKRPELPLVGDHVQPVRIDDGPLLYCLREDASLWDELSTLNLQLPTSAAAPRLLAPLDPLIYDRRLTLRLWDFDYTWEVYTPAHQRTRGYYALPVLAGDQLVGHVDPKAVSSSFRAACAAGTRPLPPFANSHSFLVYADLGLARRC
jgi:hypothetical protein